MVLFEVNSTPATPWEKAQPLVSFIHEWGGRFSSLIPSSERSPHCIQSLALTKMVLKLLVESALMFCLITAQWFVLSNKYAAYICMYCVLSCLHLPHHGDFRSVSVPDPIQCLMSSWECASAVLNASFKFLFLPVKPEPRIDLSVSVPWD